MTEWWLWPVLFGAGIVLGLFFYGGLWWTVRRMPHARHPLGLMLASFVIRLAVTVAGFMFLMGGDWRRVVTALLGFTLIRLVLVKKIRTADAI